MSKRKPDPEILPAPLTEKDVNRFFAQLSSVARDLHKETSREWTDRMNFYQTGEHLAITDLKAHGVLREAKEEKQSVIDCDVNFQVKAGDYETGDRIVIIKPKHELRNRIADVVRVDPDLFGGRPNYFVSPINSVEPVEIRFEHNDLAHFVVPK